MATLVTRRACAVRVLLAVGGGGFLAVPGRQPRWPCDSSLMPEIPSADSPQRRPARSHEDFEAGGRLTSVVYIMRGRSPFSHLGILDLSDGSLSLRDAKGSQLFAAPVATVQAHRPAGSSTRPADPALRCTRTIDGGSWSRTPSPPVPAAVDARANRALPRPRAGAESPGDERGRTGVPRAAPTRHQALWGGYWLGVLGRADSATWNF